MTVSSAEEFYGVLERSGLLGPAELDRARMYMQRADRPSAIKLAQWLVRRGYVTVWQAERLLGGNTTFFLAGKYKFMEAVAEGAMGVVFKAEHVMMGRTVAVKVLSKARLSHPNAVARFFREVQAMGALDHPNIVRADDAGQVGLTYYLVMEFVDGSDLNAWVDKYQRLPIAWACEFIRQAALGLDHAHQQGMVHRDIKPANIMVTWNENENRAVVKVLDLGLARAVDDSEAAAEEAAEDEDDTSFTHADPQLTQAGTILGTPDYLAPEQIGGREEIDARADIFGLGCTLFKLLTGQLPYSGPDLMGKLQARISPTAPPAVRLRSLLPQASEELDAIVAKMIERDPEKRYQTAAEVALALAPYAEAPKQKWTSLPSRTPERDSSEVGSTQMMADPQLREFFGGLKREPGFQASADEIPVIKSENRAIRGDVSGSGSSSGGDSGHVLEGDEPEPLGSEILAAKYQSQRARRSKLALVTIIVLIVVALVAFGAFLRVLMRPSASLPPPPMAWPGNVEQLIFVWQRGVGSAPAARAKDDEPDWSRFEAIPSARIDELGLMNLELVGAFHLRAAEKPLVEACRQTNELAIELVLSATDLKQSAADGPARIVTFSDGDDRRNFTLGQQNDELIFRLRTSEMGEGGEELHVGRLTSARWHHVVVTFAQGTVSCFVSGVRTPKASVVPGDLSSWSDQFYLMLGAEYQDRQRPWSGRLERVAIYSRAIDAGEARLRYSMARHEAPELFE